MNDPREVLRRQAEWQRAQANLPWATKVKLAESVRASIVHIQRQRPADIDNLRSPRKSD